MDCFASVRLTLCISAKIGNLQLEMLSLILQAGYVLEVNVRTRADRGDHPEDPEGRPGSDPEKSTRAALNSSWAFDAHRMVRHVLVKIREDQQ